MKQNIQANLYESYDFSPGLKFGKLSLTGVNYLRRTATGFQTRVVVAECECGVIKEFGFEMLLNEGWVCCGCTRAKRKNISTSQLHSKHPLYVIWWGIRARCCNPKTRNYNDYGGRGIAICDDWLNDYMAFYNWAIEHGWQRGLFLDREINDGHYEPNNCRFVTRAINNRNTRRNVNVTAWGETKCLWDWSSDPRCKIEYNGLRHRLMRGKWTDMEAMISSPLVERKESQRKMKSNRMLAAFGETKCLEEWLEDPRCAVKRDALRDRLEHGMPVEEAITKPRKKGSDKIDIAFENKKSQLLR